MLSEQQAHTVTGPPPTPLVKRLGERLSSPVHKATRRKTVHRLGPFFHFFPQLVTETLATWPSTSPSLRGGIVSEQAVPPPFCFTVRFAIKRIKRLWVSSSRHCKLPSTSFTSSPLFLFGHPPPLPHAHLGRPVCF